MTDREVYLCSKIEISVINNRALNFKGTKHIFGEIKRFMVSLGTVAHVKDSLSRRSTRLNHFLELWLQLNNKST